MDKLWDHLIPIKEFFENSFDATGIEIISQSNKTRPGWSSRCWTSELYRRADISVVDARETKGLWMMHSCIFPHTHNPAPIFGFDVFAGKNKITGCFHDLSPTSDHSHPLLFWFKDETRDFLWKRTRELPNWALEIFSDSIIAISNVQDVDEVEKIQQMSFKHLDYYLKHINNTNFTCNNNTKEQNFYCQKQKQNPHNPRVLCALGLSEEEANNFINTHLFPEIN